jgi:hypothetical protein
MTSEYCFFPFVIKGTIRCRLADDGLSLLHNIMASYGDDSIKVRRIEVANAVERGR